KLGIFFGLSKITEPQHISIHSATDDQPGITNAAFVIPATDRTRLCLSNRPHFLTHHGSDPPHVRTFPTPLGSGIQPRPKPRSQLAAIAASHPAAPPVVIAPLPGLAQANRPTD
ncbi:MAG: hypothetical protein ACRC8S_12175, partial [Fimbriiglobus sp.]